MLHDTVTGSVPLLSSAPTLTLENGTNLRELHGIVPVRSILRGLFVTAETIPALVASTSASGFLGFLAQDLAQSMDDYHAWSVDLDKLQDLEIIWAGDERELIYPSPESELIARFLLKAYLSPNGRS